MVRPTYELFSLETQYPKGHLNIYTTFILPRSLVEREVLLEIIMLKVLNVVVNDKSYFFGRIGRENIFLNKFF